MPFDISINLLPTYPRSRAGNPVVPGGFPGTTTGVAASYSEGDGGSSPRRGGGDGGRSPHRVGTWVYRVYWKHCDILIIYNIYIQTGFVEYNS